MRIENLIAAALLSAAVLPVSARNTCYDSDVDSGEVVTAIQNDQSCTIGGIGYRYTVLPIESASTNSNGEKPVCAGWTIPAGYTAKSRVYSSACLAGRGNAYNTLNTELLVSNQHPIGGTKTFLIGANETKSDSAAMVDPDFDRLTYTHSNLTNGTSFDLDSGTGSFTYTPPQDFTGEAFIVVTAEDGEGGIGEYHLTFKVGSPPPGNRPPVVPGITITVSSGTSTTFPLSIVGASDPDGDSFTLQLDSSGLPTHGTVSQVAGTSNPIHYRYTPNAGYVGPDAISVIATDTYPASTVGKITINVIGPDADGDGMPTAYENQWSLNSWDASDAHTDLDSDGLSNLGEYQAGTTPNVKDTDIDGMPDGFEHYHSPLNPLVKDGSQDADSDGYSNLTEYQADTDPTNAQIYPGHNGIAWLIPVIGLLLN